MQFIYTRCIDTKFVNNICQTNTTRKASPKNVCVVHFVNKGIDDLHLSSIFPSNVVINSLPKKLREEDEVPVVTVKLDPPIRNKILNYKQTVKNLDIRKEDGKFFVHDLPQCECSQSVFKDPVHNHVVTGDLRIIRNKKLRKLISKGPNFREKKS